MTKVVSTLDVFHALSTVIAQYKGIARVVKTQLSDLELMRDCLAAEIDDNRSLQEQLKKEREAHKKDNEIAAHNFLQVIKERDGLVDLLALYQKQNEKRPPNPFGTRQSPPTVKRDDCVRKQERIMENDKVTLAEGIGTKHDGGKLRYSLLPKGTISEVLKVLEFGAKKYTVIDFHDTLTIGKLIEDKLWQSKQNVYPVELLKAYYPKVTVQHVTEQSSIRKLYAQAVTNSNLSQLKMESAVLVTSLNGLPNALMNSKHVQNIKNYIVALQSFKNESENDNASEALTLSIKSNKANIHENVQSLNMGLLSTNTTLFVSEDVQCVEVQNVHTLTMTITQGNFETCFVVNATKLSDCYKTLLLLLKVCFNTSVNINEISITNSGVDNWKKVDNAQTRYYDAALRHITAWHEGEKLDSETGVSHIAHALCCLHFLMWFELNR